MPMVGDILGAEIQAAIEAVVPQAALNAESLEIWKAIAGAIVAHIKANAVVTSSTIAVPTHAPGGATTAILGDGAIS